MAVRPLALMIHGGAGPIKKEDYPFYQNGIEQVLRQVTPMLGASAGALDIVERAVVLLEEHPQFNTGIGSALREDGSVRMDASIMDGSCLACGAVGCVGNLLHPISVARCVMEVTPHILLVGEGANEFARKQGFEEVPEGRLITARRRERWEKEKAKRARKSEQEGGRAAPPAGSSGTVGAVALDSEGRLAAATSTGGMFFSPPARVGDTPLIGAGTYADQAAAVSATGIGEVIIKVTLAKSCVDLVRGGLSPQGAADAAIRMLAQRTGSTAGLVVVDNRGRVGAAYRTKRMSYGWYTPDEGIMLPPLQ